MDRMDEETTRQGKRRTDRSSPAGAERPETVLNGLPERDVSVSTFPSTPSSISPTKEDLAVKEENEVDGRRFPSGIDWGAELETNQGWLRTVIAARVGEAEGVEEVFQEVSLAAVRQKAPIHDPTKVSPWLYRLAVIHSLLYRRKIGRKKKLIDRFTQKIPIVENDQRQREPLEWLLEQERRQMVKEAMKQIPKPFQELLLLKYIHDWSYKEMAEKLGMTVSAVQAKLHRARGMLKKRLTRTISAEDVV